MNMISCTVAVLLACCSSAFSFDNIEADATYDGAMKQQIKGEFALGLQTAGV